MKKQIRKKLSLSRETLLGLEEARLIEVPGGANTLVSCSCPPSGCLRGSICNCP